VYFASGQYFDTIPNVAGCDSIIEINLDVTTIDNTISLLEEGFAANQDDADYQWLDCDMDMMEIDGATGQEFFPDVDGNYAVRISLNDCEKTSECYEIFGLSAESNIADGLKIYPNPTDGLVKIELPELKSNIQVSVYDGTGRLILDLSAQNTDYLECTIEVPKAVYLIKIFADDKMYSKAIVVE
ncbi:MAG: T9SS type A sorting domain-containing protein, partial [Bacteroidales bacterium]